MKKKKKQNKPKKCYELCRYFKVSCPNEGCSLYIDYEEDLNCVFEAIRKEGGPMTLAKVGKRMKISPSEVKRIETLFFKRMKKLFNKEKEFTNLKDYL